MESDWHFLEIPGGARGGSATSTRPALRIAAATPTQPFGTDLANVVTVGNLSRETFGIYETTFRVVNLMNSPTPSIELREAKSPEELHAIYRFRYEIYVEEMQRKQHYADHDARLIKDPLDENGWNIAAWEGDTVVGVVRVNPIADPATESYARLYDVAAEDGVNHEEATLVSRLMTRKHLRGTRLAQRLAVASFEWITGAGYRTVYIDCNAHLVDWFRALGFKVARRVEHPEYGLVSVMRLDVYDEEHLDKLKSPFLAVLRQIQGNEAEWKTWVSNNLAQQ